MQFKIQAPFALAGDQIQAVAELTAGLQVNKKHQVLLGATGTGKTFTIANVIQNVQKPTLVIAHNKTLAAQLASEFKSFFPENAVEYFVSYYDYYQPEAYIPNTDTYIEKDASINQEIDKLRHSATSSLCERRDVIVVASVSCIYGLGSPDEYYNLVLSLRLGQQISRQDILRKLVDIQYQRNDIEFARGTFRVRGDVIEVLPAGVNDVAIRIEMFGEEIDALTEMNIITGEILARRNHVAIYPASHYVTSKENLQRAIGDIKVELAERLQYFQAHGKLLEAQRLEQRTNYDIEMMQEMGYCSGIENYSRHLSQRPAGEGPFTLIDYFPEDFLLVIDEAHVTIPQVRAMYAGDRSRKDMLVNYGFRLPSAYDNRPLKFEEFVARLNQVIYVSATPADYELNLSEATVEQIIRPTGLLDPVVEVRATAGQIDNLLSEIYQVVSRREKVLVTTLTKKMAEELTAYLKEMSVRVQYLHSDIHTLQRAELIDDLKQDKYDVLVGVNLLREGLDLPEVSLVIILDADKEGFLRSRTSMIQTIGRAARNENGKVIMYADNITKSMQAAIEETNRRREKQIAYNTQHNIKPKSIKKDFRQLITTTKVSEEEANYNAKTGKKTAPKLTVKQLQTMIKKLTKQMQVAAKEWNFEEAKELRDQITKLQAQLPK
ncbi:excinuclease ABC subunit UvrB [Succinispira mobilis]|uniref:excinuclease ABC subunit UvrB n=1 Tax=Succinispira mobilis TaxID=78120 RepID=UPI00035DBA0C|nr:excinuclease ABC subunit UvrB [Succinispira mobilis]